MENLCPHHHQYTEILQMQECQTIVDKWRKSPRQHYLNATKIRLHSHRRHIHHSIFERICTN